MAVGPNEIDLHLDEVYVGRVIDPPEVPPREQALPPEFEKVFVSDATKIKERMKRFGETLSQATENVAAANNRSRVLSWAQMYALDARYQAEQASDLISQLKVKITRY